MAGANVTIGAFPEQVVGGYPPEDLVQWPGFLIGQREALAHFAQETRSSPTVYVVGLAASAGGQIFNTAAVVHRGHIAGVVPKEKLPVALKGASDSLRDMFFSNMSERAAKLLKDDIASMGPVRLRDVDEAQMEIVALAKDMAARGDIALSSKKGEDELVY